MKLIAFVLAFVFVAPVFSEIVKMNGSGEAIVGSDQTQEHGEALAFLKAKADAISKLGSYVESNIQIEKTEMGGVSEITRSTLRGFMGGTIKFLEGSKTVSKEFRDEEQKALGIHVTAQFQVDMDEYKKNLESFATQRQEKDELRRKFEALAEAESGVIELTTIEQISDGQIALLLTEYNKAQVEAARAIVSLSGGAIVAGFTKKKDTRTEAIRTYLNNIASIKDPSSIWTTKILGDPKVDEVDQDNVMVTATVEVKENKRVVEALGKNHAAFKQDLYSSGRPDYVTRRIGDPVAHFPLALCFLNADGKVLAFAIYLRDHNMFGTLGGVLTLFQEEAGAFGNSANYDYSAFFYHETIPKKKIIHFGIVPDSHQGLLDMDRVKIEFRAKLGKSLLRETHSIKPIFLLTEANATKSQRNRDFRKQRENEISIGTESWGDADYRPELWFSRGGSYKGVNGYSRTYIVKDPIPSQEFSKLLGIRISNIAAGIMQD